MRTKNFLSVFDYLINLPTKFALVQIKYSTGLLENDNKISNISKMQYRVMSEPKHWIQFRSVKSISATSKFDQFQQKMQRFRLGSWNPVAAAPIETFWTLILAVSLKFLRDSYSFLYILNKLKEPFKCQIYSIFKIIIIIVWFVLLRLTLFLLRL